MLQDNNPHYRTITNDNGGEFLRNHAITKDVFFCAPRKPQQRGTVENTIGLLRQYIKRSESIQNYSQSRLQSIQDSLNHRPRKCLGWKTPFEVHFNKKVALALQI